MFIVQYLTISNETAIVREENFSALGNAQTVARKRFGRVLSREEQDGAIVEAIHADYTTPQIASLLDSGNDAESQDGASEDSAGESAAEEAKLAALLA